MTSDVSEAVIAAIQSVLRDTGRREKRVETSMLLSGDLGLDSLDLAQTIVLLERTLGVDPFRVAALDRPPVRTVADLVSMYARALSCSESEDR
jgi:acyl carrier protein